MLEKLYLAAPRGFCAGVAYAIEVVDLALKIHGAPLYVRHAIVHNEYVVRSFQKRGVVFVEDLFEVPEGAVVVFSAHGVSPDVRAEAVSRKLTVVDATCPLVTKVHNEVKRYASKGYHLLYIGHRGHAEAVGTMGEAPDRMTLVETVAEAQTVMLPEHDKLAFVTQTTLSVDEVQTILGVLQERFPHIEKAHREDICYATTNRQASVKELAEKCDMVLVVGSRTSSNSNRLREVAESRGAEAHLLLGPEDVDPSWADRCKVIGVTSGASTPEALVEDVIGKLVEGRASVPVEVLETVKESVEFRPPRDLMQLARAD
jgi:4-hydroxy-3-methylbut-2-enyl diphosphate reductase